MPEVVKVLDVVGEDFERSRSAKIVASLVYGIFFIADPEFTNQELDVVYEAVKQDESLGGSLEGEATKLTEHPDSYRFREDVPEESCLAISLKLGQRVVETLKLKGLRIEFISESVSEHYLVLADDSPSST